MDTVKGYGVEMLEKSNKGKKIKVQNLVPPNVDRGTFKEGIFKAILKKFNIDLDYIDPSSEEDKKLSKI